MRTLATIVMALLGTTLYAQGQRIVYVDPTASYGGGEDTIARFVRALQEHPTCEDVDPSAPCTCRMVTPMPDRAGADYIVWFESTGDRTAATVWDGESWNGDRRAVLLVGIADAEDAEAVAASVCELIER